MAEFGAAATLEISVPDRELRAARREIEDEIGDVEVGVDAGGIGGPSSTMADGGGSLGLDDTIQTAQLEKLEDIHEEIETMAATEGDGGGMGMLTTATAVTGGASILGALGGGLGFPIGAFGRGGGKPSDQRLEWMNDIREKLGKPPLEEGDWPKSRGPQWMQNIDDLTLTEPTWVDNLDQVDWSDPAWLDGIGQVKWSGPTWLDGIGEVQWSGPAWLDGIGQVKWSAPDWVDRLFRDTQSDDTTGSGNDGGGWAGDPTTKGAWWTGPDPFNFGGDGKTPREQKIDNQNYSQVGPPGNRASRDRQATFDVNMDGQINVEDARDAVDEIAEEAADIAREQLERQLDARLGRGP